LPLPAACGFTHLWAHLDFWGTWPGLLGQALAHCGCLGRLTLSGIGWGLCRWVWGRSGSWGPGLVHGPCLGGCCSWFPGGLFPMLMGALSGGFLCSLLGGFVVVPVVVFCAPLGLPVAWVLWPSLPASDCFGAVDCGSVHLYTHYLARLSCRTCAMCIACLCTHTHTLIIPVACSLSSCCVILWFQVIYIHSCVVCDCRYLCLFLFVWVGVCSLLVCL